MRALAAAIATGLVLTACGGAEPSTDDGASGSTATASTVGEVVAELTVLDEDALRRPAEQEDFLAAATGDPVAIADLLRTDATGWVQIDWFDGSLTRLDADTDFEVVAVAGTPESPEIRARLDVGRTWHRVHGIDGEQGSFAVDTAVATATVRGTAFVVACLPDGTCTFAVLEGVVVVTVDEDEFELQAGDRLTVRPDGTNDGIESVGVNELRADAWVARNLARDEGEPPPSAEAEGNGGRFDEFGPPDATDPAGDMSEPSVDIIATRTGLLPDDGRGWILFEFAGEWPPSRDFYSWYVEVQGFDADGNPVNRAGTEWHAGVRTPVVAPVEEVVVDGGLLIIVPARPSVDAEMSYSWLSNFHATEGGQFEQDLPDQGLQPWQFENVVDPRS